MKRLSVFTVFLAMILAPAALTAYAQEKIPLTEEQLITGKLPDGIFNVRNSAAVHVSAVQIPELVKGWENPTYSPDRRHIAYTLEGDLYTINVASKKIHRHTYDGSFLVGNGRASWVYYEEIFGRKSNYRAFWWSPDSKVVAFYRFDDSNVPEFPLFDAAGQHGSLRMTRYPKAGDPNPEVKLGFVSVNGDTVIWADFKQVRDQYFGTPFWDHKGKRLLVPWMDRSQDDMIIYSVDPLYGQKKQIYSEHQDSWVEFPDEILCNSKGAYMVRDKGQWQRIGFLSYDGKTFRYADDHKDYWGIKLIFLNDNYLFFTARGAESMLRNDIYRINLSSNAVERISFGDYDFTNVRVEKEGRFVYATLSNCHTPPKDVEIELHKLRPVKDRNVDVLFDSKGRLYDHFKIAEREIVYVTMRDGVKLPASVIWPVDMDRSGKTRYPVKVDIYGGPGSQQVFDRYAPVNFESQWWANHGVVQVRLDTRSAGHLGRYGENTVYLKLGIPELEDLIDGIKYFTNLSFIDARKVGVEGYSYGGTMALLAATEANDYFQYAIASGGVYDWQLYDSHYTERYMERPEDNSAGYEASAVIDRLGNYRGDKTNMVRITHGTGDDNVHMQNTLQVADCLQRDGKDFELMLYPGGMHGYRGDQQWHFNMQNMRFWYRYLLEQEMPDVLRNK
ncbi:MAG: DPP IV N-terminal domain-containing protein [Bacteroidales bacterium]|nr:DPP IV N-terminal domain-containing protein [Bacteroidales bacterium]